jgi:hypothetical protein
VRTEGSGGVSGFTLISDPAPYTAEIKSGRRSSVNLGEGSHLWGSVVVPVDSIVRLRRRLSGSFEGRLAPQG